MLLCIRQQKSRCIMLRWVNWSVLYSDVSYRTYTLDCVWNVTAHAQEPGFVFRRNGTSPFKSAGASVQSTAGSQDVRISGSNAGYTMFRGSVKSTGYPNYSPLSPSLLLPCVTVCHHISTGPYLLRSSIANETLLHAKPIVSLYTYSRCLVSRTHAHART
jgi:hypothetical protein